MDEKLSYQELEEKVRQLESELEIARIQELTSSKNCELLQVLLDSIPNPIFYKNRVGVYQNCNDAFSQILFGINKDLVISKSLLELSDFIPPELALHYHEHDLTWFNEPCNKTYKEAIRCIDGEVRAFAIYKAAVTDADGKIIGVVGIMNDVTEVRKQKKELEQLNRRLETDSLTDPLTGLFNRRKFEHVFVKSLRVSKRYKRLLNFAILDIDNFKKYNDTFGHIAGDNALVLIARALKSSLSRADDFIFRLGGEEFGILFFSENEEKAVDFANNIRLVVQRLNINHDTGDEYNCVTVSMGMVTIKDHSKKILSIYDRADNLLYQAKNSGKNQLRSEELK